MIEKCENVMKSLKSIKKVILKKYMESGIEFIDFDPDEYVLFKESLRLLDLYGEIITEQGKLLNDINSKLESIDKKLLEKNEKILEAK